MSTIDRQSALAKVLQIASNKSAKVVTYGAALLGIAALIPNFQLPQTLGVIAGSIGVEAIGILLDKVSDGEVSELQIQRQLENIVAQSGIRNLLTQDDFYHAFGHLLNEQRKISKQNRQILKIIRESSAPYEAIIEKGSKLPQGANFQDLLSVSVKDVKKYLARNPNVLLLTFCPIGTYTGVSNFSLGKAQHIDFLIVQLWSTVTRIILIELESPIVPIYRNGTFSNELNISLQKIQDHFTWIAEHQNEFCSSILQHIKTKKPGTFESLQRRLKYNSVIAKIIIGRRDMLSETDRSRLMAYNKGDRDIEIVTFDRLFDVAKSIHRS